MTLAAFPQQQQALLEGKNGGGTFSFRLRALNRLLQRYIPLHLFPFTPASHDIFIYLFTCVQLDFLFFWPDYVQLCFLSSRTFQGNQSAAILDGWYAAY